MTPAIKSRYGLVSLLDMLKVFAHAYIAIGMRAGQMTKWLDTAIRMNPLSGAEMIDDALAKELAEFVEMIEAECVRSEMLTVLSSTEWFRKHYDESRPTRAQARDFVGHITFIFTAELNKQMLFQVSEADRAFFETALEAEIITAFPSASREIEDAGRCFALDQWTASVMHLMRGLEFGITSLVSALKFTTSNLNWHIVLNECEREIRNIGANKPTPTWKEDEEFYSEVATTFRHFKGAWRNHAMHGHETYDQRQAVVIFMNVREFFTHISKRLSE